MDRCTADALEALKQTSRTFYIPISRLPVGLQEAVTSAYLCMRAIDEIEDHPDLESRHKVALLQTISLSLQEATEGEQFERLSLTLNADPNPLPEVSIRVGEWARLAPPTIAPRIWDATAAMSDRMAYWASRNWQVNTEEDLNRYTFSVAGAVGLLLSDLWAWYDGTQTNRSQAIGFGRGLQAVNILRNHKEDLKRGVDFFPNHWTDEQMQTYARHNLALADAYTMALPKGPALGFCQIPLALAHATLDVLAEGHEKLSRSAVVALVQQLTRSK
ncbi:phytoene/squalene synthase family protein [Lusitaniella coriacea LEGE 07157]|uniref:Phytoene/squalene synthase family protein n=1 Tax=Lusitaniella coriacea LEGE 07157 TaxID=945747 RepID=A0A8J7DWS9_9CYAN|nr:phytoene/squalene synthase family protein [Lusitaniella coriacea]MBE9116611.1 phytoene/squalene synthase family protein [Lusitaniella coriacea LEGE 07157]